MKFRQMHKIDVNAFACSIYLNVDFLNQYAMIIFALNLERCQWLKGAVLKTVGPLRVPWVQNPTLSAIMLKRPLVREAYIRSQSRN